MPSAQSSLNPWIISYISQHKESRTRYQIDKYLIEAGYNPAEIELVWQAMNKNNGDLIGNKYSGKLNQHSSNSDEPSTSAFTWFRQVLWLVNSLSVALLLVFYLMASSQAAKEGSTKIFFSDPKCYTNKNYHIYFFNFHAVSYFYNWFGD